MTTTGQGASSAQLAGTIPVPVLAAPPTPPPVSPDAILGAYPHVARCPSCRRYVLEWTDFKVGYDVVTAALAYHESSHSFDLLTTASQHFAGPPELPDPS